MLSQFPQDDAGTPILSGKTPDGQPFVADLGGFPVDAKGGKGDRGKEGDDGDDAPGEVFIGQIWNYIGNDLYRVFRHFRRKQVAGRVIEATWLHPNAWHPPLAADTWVVCALSLQGGHYVFQHAEYGWILGEVKSYCGPLANIPTGWLLCNKTNHDAGPVNGITVDNMTNRVYMGYGTAATTEGLDPDDVIWDTTDGEAGGFNAHGADLDLGGGGTQSGADISGGGTNMHRQHRLTLVTDTFADGENAGLTDVYGTDEGPPFHELIHDWSDNRMPFVARGFICFVGV